MIEVPKEVEDQLEESESIFGFKRSLFGENMFLTKKGCATKRGCENFLYLPNLENGSYEKKRVTEDLVRSLSKWERKFVMAFIWD